MALSFDAGVLCDGNDVVAWAYQMPINHTWYIAVLLSSMPTHIGPYTHYKDAIDDMFYAFNYKES